MEISRRSFVKGLVCSPVLLLTGCDPNSMMGLDPKGELSGKAVWNDASLIRSYLNEVYSGVGWGYGDPMITGLADEAKNTHGHGDAPMRLSNLTPDNRGLWDWGWERVVQKFDWSDLYSHFRDINIFLENIEGTEALSSSQKETLKGEAHFLRAFYYHNLLRLYGGVPIVDKVFDLSGDETQYHVPRASFKETVDFIVADLDKAADRLSVQAAERGRATKGAALALKSRVLLHAASDLFADPAAITGDPELQKLIGYPNGGQTERWRKAQQAAKAVIDLNQYSLYDGNYEDIWLQENNPEIIWARYFTSAASEVHNHSLWTSPNGYSAWGGDCPLQQHVDAYEMADGTPFDWNNSDHAADPYKNRDPRFYANIHYNGRKWRERPEGLQDADPRGVIQTGSYETADGTMRPGLDTRSGPVQDWNGTKTGYYTRKFHDKSVVPHQEQQYNPWIFARYGEILLNYAEASAELGETSEALDKLNQIRSRAGMPNVPADGGQGYSSLIDRIRNERAVELAFEEHRYFDVRRWKIAPDVYKNGKGIEITGKLSDEENGELLVENYYEYDYKVIEVDERQWDDKSYFLPIHRSEMQRNPELKQNPGYS